MSKKIRKFKSTVIFFALFLILFNLMTYSASVSAKSFSLTVVMNVKWDSEETMKPIVPIDEINELDLRIIFQLVSDEYIGKGALLFYISSANTAVALPDINIVETSPGCSAVLKQNRFSIQISEYYETKVKLYLSFDENVPAYSDGYVKIKLSCLSSLGLLIEGFEDVFELHFTPSYKPIINVNLPEENTKRINPTEKAIFPIEVENIGNARTEVNFEIENVPEGWEATITEQVFLEETKGSKATVYLTVIPPDQLGFHYDEANIRVKMTPAQAENPVEVGQPLYATFAVQNRGSSANGIELILFFIIIIIKIIVLIVFILKWMRRKKEKTLP